MPPGTVTVSKTALHALMRFVEEEISRLKKELGVIEEEIRSLERKYGVESNEFVEMLERRREWGLPEGSEPDVVEWEALLEQRKVIERKLRELEELWNQLRGYSRY